MLANHAGTANSFNGTELYFHVQFHSYDLCIMVTILLNYFPI